MYLLEIMDQAASCSPSSSYSNEEDLSWLYTEMKDADSKLPVIRKSVILI